MGAGPLPQDPRSEALFDLPGDGVHRFVGAGDGAAHGDEAVHQFRVVQVDHVDAGVLELLAVGEAFVAQRVGGGEAAAGGVGGGRR